MKRISLWEVARLHYSSHVCMHATFEKDHTPAAPSLLTLQRFLIRIGREEEQHECVPRPDCLTIARLAGPKALLTRLCICPRSVERKMYGISYREELLRHRLLVREYKKIKETSKGETRHISRVFSRHDKSFNPLIL